MKPILLKCGLALALAFTLLVSTLTSEHEESNLPLLPPGDKMRKEETCINKVFDKNSPIILSPRTKQSGEKDEFLNDLMREGDFVAVNSSKKEVFTVVMESHCCFGLMLVSILIGVYCCYGESLLFWFGVGYCFVALQSDIENGQDGFVRGLSLILQVEPVGNHIRLEHKLIDELDTVKANRELGLHVDSKCCITNWETGAFSSPDG
ncbi:Protein CHUP1, chloroplastic [Sesbania bispinosa]|nr:Protein CHUP1, chloroplastic [Sesbania bispinosa]